MKTRKLWYMLLVLVLAIAMAVSISVGALADEDDTGDSGGEITSNGMTMSKYVHVQDDGTFILDLDAFATGEVTTTISTTPCDIVLVLDVSGSMDQSFGSGTNVTYVYTARASQAYSYDGYGNNTYYYKHTDGNYYPVTRNRTGTTGNRRYNLSVRINNTTYYLSGTGITTTNPNVSGSNTTIWTGVLYTRRQETKMDALKAAVSQFIDIVAEKNAAPEATEKSRVSIVKFAFNRYPWNNSDQSSAANGTPGNYDSNNGQYIGDSSFNWSSPGYTSVNNANYTQVVQNMTEVTAANAGTMKTTVNGLHAAGATAADFGMALAQEVLTDNPIPAESDRQQIVVMFTDGSPTYQSDFQSAVANAAIGYAKTMKGNGAKVFSVAVLQGADPTNVTTDVNKYLHGVSSNYPNATGIDSLGTRYTDEQGNTPDFYYTAANSSQLSGIFAAIAHSAGGTTTEVGTEAILKDVVGSSFTLPPEVLASEHPENAINVSIVRWNSYTHAWGTAEDTQGGPYVYTPEAWATYTHDNYTTTNEQGQTVDGKETVTVSVNGADVDVTGFDYAKDFKATTPEQDNDAVDKPNGVNKDTAKVVISFVIDAKPSSVTGGHVATNGENSGLYVNGELLIKFPQPDVVFTPVTYVVDYVTSDTSTDTKASSVKLEYDTVLDNVEMLDDPSDDVLIGKDAVDFNYTIYKGKYGTISFGDDEFDVQRRYVRYAPTTMNWDGYDRIFIKGKSATGDAKDVWAMLAVLPANSVFYEDTYITQTKTVHYNGGDVDIVYTGINYDSSWDTVGTEGKNQTYHAGDEMGWISGLADDSEYANDMAHTTSTSKAKASFTFSGTGVDIYSRTNGSTGTVLVQIKSAADENTSGKKVAKSKIIDTKAAAGDFFAIPVCTFTDLAYGKYTVTITVSTGNQAENRVTFYLDGVRVYNPIQPLEGDGNVEQMYGEKNLGAVFTEVRSLLGTGATASALYIDEHTESKIVTDLDAITAAAKALSEAQQARDKYVQENITPAKNAVSAEEYALSQAESAVTAATNVLTAAQKALAADPENTELQAAVAKAQTDLTTAEAALDEAQAHYDAAMPGLQQALNDAIAGRAAYDDAVNDARDEYDRVNDGVVLEYTTTDVAEYNKEGPKSEVLLQKNQQVAINVESGKYYYVGLRSLNGNEVEVQINNQTLKLSHTADLYYEATPESGTTIVIKNVSDNILSITKLRTTAKGNTTSGAKMASTAETLDYVRSLAAMAATNYTGDVLTGDEAAGEVVPTVPEVTETTVNAEDITIENAESEPEAEPAEETQTTASGTLAKLLKSFFRFYRP